MINYQIGLKIFRTLGCKWLFCLWQMSMALHLCGSEILINPVPVAVIINPCPQCTLINSVDFHPKKNLFCVTYAQGNRVVLYKNDASGKPEIVQTLRNPSARLSSPQHAVFSSDGKKIIVANWTSQTLSIYQGEENGLFGAQPSAVIPRPKGLKRHRPHGIAMSPCGNFLAIAYGASSRYGKAIALFLMTENGCKLVSILQASEGLPGIPKGITFSPDGTCLLVTFSDVNSLVIFDFDSESQVILPTPRQTIQGENTGISRPEDVKISRDGRFCAITNSDKHTVNFYPFDQFSNSITQSTPSYVLQNPEAGFSVPHGIAFSPDGCFMVITEFGPVGTTKHGDIIMSGMRPDQSKVSIYKLL